MLGWVDDIEKVTLDNDDFRRVLHTGEYAQLVVMTLGAGEEIGWEAHHDIDQFIRLEAGQARVDFGSSEDEVDESHKVGGDDAFIVPAGVWHNVTNTGDEPVRLYTIYSPPEHPDGTVHHTKEEADADEHHH